MLKEKNDCSGFQIDQFINLAKKQYISKNVAWFWTQATLDLDRLSIGNHFWWLLYTNLFLKYPTASNSEYLNIGNSEGIV